MLITQEKGRKTMNEKQIKKQIAYLERKLRKVQEGNKKYFVAHYMTGSYTGCYWDDFYRPLGFMTESEAREATKKIGFEDFEAVSKEDFNMYCEWFAMEIVEQCAEKIKNEELKTVVDEVCGQFFREHDGTSHIDLTGVLPW